MPILAEHNMTLLDHAMRTSNKGTQAFVNMLSQDNPLEDIIYKEGNESDGETVKIQNGLPKVYYKRFNKGVPPSKSTYTEQKFKTYRLVGATVTDAELARKGGKINQLREQDKLGQIEAMQQKFASNLFYGDELADMDACDGLNKYYATVNPSQGAAARNVIDAGGTGSDNASIYLVTWGLHSCYGIYDKGTTLGINHKDYGETMEKQPDGTELAVFKDMTTFCTGLVMKDWRYSGRICNIDRSNLDGGSGASIFTLLTKLMHTVKSSSSGRRVLYMDDTILSSLDLQAQTLVNSGGGITYANVDGKQVMDYRGIPIRKMDCLRVNEQRVA